MMPEKDDRTLTGGGRQSMEPSRTDLEARQDTAPVSASVSSQPKNQPPIHAQDQTLTGGIQNKPPNEQTLTAQSKSSRTDVTITHKVGVGTGELVDKVNWDIGDVIDGRFEIISIIGQGGMGVVYKVHHREWKLDLAVKMPLVHLVADAASKERFIREAQTWVDLGLHPNIVQCWYVRELGGIPRVFMDYIGGGSLKEWIRNGKINPGEWDRILDFIIQACDGLGYAHERGVEVHRDVKPGNMLLTEEGELLVTDFGIVKRADSAEIEEAISDYPRLSETHDTITQTGSELGTPEYSAPEQWGTAKHADSRADIYALGVILYELCCGRRPFDDGSHREPAHVLIGRHLSTPPPDPRKFYHEIPELLVDIILQCLQKKPSDRPASMYALREELAKIYSRLIKKSYRRPIPETTDLLADALNNRAVSLMDLNQEAEAFKSWKEALKRDAYHSESIYNNALVEWRDAKILDEEIVRRLEEARHAGKRASFYLGLIHLERADAEQAEEELLDALQDDELKENGSLWRALGDAQLAQQKYTAAEASYQYALELIPEDSFSIDGLLLAQTGTRKMGDQVLYAWQHCVCAFESGHRDEVTALAVTTNGRYVLSGSADCTLRFWSLSTRECIHTLKGHEEMITAVAIAPNGHYAVSGSQDRSLRLWDLRTGKALWTARGHTDWISAVAVTPDSHHIVSGSQDMTLRYWDVSTGKCVWTSAKHSTWINDLAVTPDGRYVLTAHDEENLYLWELATGKRTERKFYGSSLEVLGFSWSPTTALTIAADGSFALAGNQNTTLRLWDLSTGESGQVYKGHDEKINGVAITSDGQLAVSASEDSTLRLWDIKTAEVLWTFEGHRGGVTSVTITQDGQRILSGGRDGTVRIWDMETRKPVWIFWAEQGHRQGVTSITTALRGRFLVSAGWDATLRLWDLASAQELKLFEGHTREVTAVTATPDGRRVISGSRDATLCLWDLGTRKCLRTFKGNRHSITALAVTRNGRFIISGNEEGMLYLWSQETGKRIRTFKGHKGSISALAVTPEDRFVISASHDGTLRLWDLSTSKCLYTFTGHTGPVTAVAVSPDRQLIASGSRDRTIRTWDFASAQCLQTIEGHKKTVTALVILPDQRFMLSGSADKTIRLWEIITMRCLRTFTNHSAGITSLELMPDGRFVASTSKDKTLRLWNLDPEAQRYEAAIQLCQQLSHEDIQTTAGRFRKRLAWAQAAWESGKATAAYKYLTQARAIPGYERSPEALHLNAALGEMLPKIRLRGEWTVLTYEGHHKPVTTLAVTPNCKYIVSGSTDMTLRLWELANGKCLLTFDGHWLGVTALAITPDGRFVISGSEDAQVRLWDITSGNCVRVYEGHDKDVLAVAVTLYGRFIISGGADTTVRIWNPATAKCLRVFQGHKKGVTALTTTPDRRFIISGSQDRMVRVWERTTGKCIQVLKGHRGGISTVLVMQNGNYLFSGGQDGTIRLWDLRTAKCVRVLRSPDAEFTSISLTADHRFLVAGRRDATMQLWNLRTAKSAWTFRGHKQSVNAVFFTPDGRFIVSGSDDRSMRLWELDWELGINDSPDGSPEQGKNSGFLNRLTSLFNTAKKK